MTVRMIVGHLSRQMLVLASLKWRHRSLLRLRAKGVTYPVLLPFSLKAVPPLPQLFKHLNSLNFTRSYNLSRSHSFISKVATCQTTNSSTRTSLSWCHSAYSSHSHALQTTLPKPSQTTLCSALQSWHQF